MKNKILNKLLFLILLCFFVVKANAQNTPTTQTLTGTATITCPQDNTLTLQNSETNFNYFLRNNTTKEVIGNPQTGTASSLNFQTGSIAATTNYHVFAANPSYALDFDGTDDIVEIPHDPSMTFTDGITIDAWVKPTNQILNQTFSDIYIKANHANGVEKGRIFLIFDNSDNDNSDILLRFYIETASGVKETFKELVPADIIDTWTHILAFYDNATDIMRLYINGIEVHSTAIPGDDPIVNPTASNATFATIGGHKSPTNGNYSSLLKGKIASLRIWDKALTSSTEIQQAKDNLFVGDEAGLVAYYPFFENAGSTLTDSSSNTNNGTINSATWATGTTGGLGKVTSNTQTITFSPVINFYVDKTATGANNGTSWADAFTTITQATNFINNKCFQNPNDVIYIAKGTYKEGAEITINKAITIKGGYPTGGGTQDIANNPTFLDGNTTHRVLNATHTTGTLYLEGLTIQNGKISGAEVTIGAGIKTTGNLNLQFCKIHNNTTSASASASSILNSFGGGIYTVSGSITLNNSLVLNNTSTADYYNGIFVNSYGGGIYTNSGSITINNSQVSNNTCSATNFLGTSKSSGGGVYTNSGGSITLTNSQVSNNTCSATISYGGGISNPASSGSISLINSQVSNNIIHAKFSYTTSAYGGGVYGNTTLQNSILWGNTKFIGANGIAISSEHDNGTLTANYSLIKGLFLNNSNNTNNIDPSVANFEADNFIDVATGNFALRPGSVLLNAGNNTYNTTTEDLAGNPRKVGEIDIGAYEVNFSGKNYNTAATSYYFNTASTATNQDGLTWATAFDSLNDYFYIINKTNINKIYLATGVYKTSGTLNFVTQVELYGGYNPATDMPESLNKSTIDVQQNGRVIATTQKITLNQINVFNGLRKEINNDARGGGLYSIDDKDIILRNSQVTGNTASAYNLSRELGFSEGGGIYALQANLTLINSHVTGNTASTFGESTDLKSKRSISKGGGIFKHSGSVILNNSQVTNNTAISTSISFVYSSSTIADPSSSSSSSSSYSEGGGIYNSRGSITINNSQVSNNTTISTSVSTFDSAQLLNSIARSYGGGVYTDNGSITLTNSQVSNNKASATAAFYSNSPSNSIATSFGGGIYKSYGDSSSDLSLINSQVINNIAFSNTVSSTSSSTDPYSLGGGIYGSTILQNSILWNNTRSADGGTNFTPSEHYSGTLTANYSLIKNQNPTGTNNIDATVGGFNPIFVNEAGGDFRLQAGSPLINAGLDSYNTTTADLDNNARKVGTIDIGAYEFNSAANANTSWTGATNTLWQEPSNWNNGVPDANSNVTIPTGLGNYPTVTNLNNATAFNVDNNTGASLNINAGKGLTVGNNLTNNGTIIIHSDVTSSGSLQVKGTATGNITYNRYVTDNWHTVGAPVIGQNIQQVAENNQVIQNGDNTKYAIAPYNNDIPSSNWEYVLVADIATAGNFTNGKGYSMKRSPAGIYSFTGSIENNNKTVTLTDGSKNNWNLIANPYPSFLKFNNLADASSNLLLQNINELNTNSLAIYIWDTTTSGYKPYNHASTNLQYIAPGQAFFVNAKDGGGSFTFNKSLQTTHTGNVFARNSNSIFEISLQISDGTNIKSTEIKYLENTTKGLDAGYDAETFTAQDNSFSVYTHLLADNANKPFALQCLPPTDFENKIIPIGVNTDANTTISFSVDAQNIPTGINIYLEDKQENTFTKLNNNENYEITLLEAQSGVGRFYLHTTSQVLNTEDFSTALEMTKIWLADKRILKIANLSSEKATVTLFDLLGKEVLKTRFNAENMNTTVLPNSIKQAVYLVRLQTTKGMKTTKIFIK